MLGRKNWRGEEERRSKSEFRKIRDEKEAEKHEEEAESLMGQAGML